VWAPGNENLHAFCIPVGSARKAIPRRAPRADAFVAFLAILVDRIHEPIRTIRSSIAMLEDISLGRLMAGFDATGVERPWLIYDANVYSPTRLQQIIARSPT